MVSKTEITLSVCKEINKKAYLSSQILPRFHCCIHIKLFPDLIHNGRTVYLSHPGIALIHVYKADKTQNTNHQA